MEKLWVPTMKAATATSTSSAAPATAAPPPTYVALLATTHTLRVITQMAVFVMRTRIAPRTTAWTLCVSPAVTPQARQGPS